MVRMEQLKEFQQISNKTPANWKAIDLAWVQKWREGDVHSQNVHFNRTCYRALYWQYISVNLSLFIAAAINCHITELSPCQLNWGLYICAFTSIIWWPEGWHCRSDDGDDDDTFNFTRSVRAHAHAKIKWNRCVSQHVSTAFVWLGLGLGLWLGNVRAC